jgi:uncharacterized protein YjiS (DUF1127 family)
MTAPLNFARRPTDVYRFEAAVRGAAWGWLGEQIAALVAKHRGRQTARELAVLSDQELRDVGLLRAEIDQVAANGSSARS